MLPSLPASGPNALVFFHRSSLMCLSHFLLAHIQHNSVPNTRWDLWMYTIVVKWCELHTSQRDHNIPCSEQPVFMVTLKSQWLLAVTVILGFGTPGLNVKYTMILSQTTQNTFQHKEKAQEDPKAQGSPHHCGCQLNSGLSVVLTHVSCNLVARQITLSNCSFRSWATCLSLSLSSNWHKILS